MSWLTEKRTRTGSMRNYDGLASSQDKRGCYNEALDDDESMTDLLH